MLDQRTFSVSAAVLVLFLAGCSQREAPAQNQAAPDAPKSGEAASAPQAAAGAAALAAVKDGKPVGLFFMTRYWSGGSLEKAAWYFTQDGKVYQNLEGGVTPQDLSAHKGRHGAFRREGAQMEVQWSDGKSTRADFEPDQTDPNHFMWDMGLFGPAKSFASAQAAAGTYEGGESLAHAGNRAIVSKKLELRADGTFAWEGVAFLKGTTEQSQLAAGDAGAATGTWKLDGFTVTLAESTGHVRRMLAFPYDDEKTPLTPDWMFFGGMLYKRQAP